MGRYMTRAAVREQDFSVSEDLRTVLYRGEFNPGIKRNFEAMDSLEWLAKVMSQIPDRHEKGLTYTGWYSSVVRSVRKKKAPAPFKADIPLSQRKSRRAWARLIRKAFGVDPMRCPKCGKTLKLIIVIEDLSLCPLPAGHDLLPLASALRPYPLRRIQRSKDA